VSAVIALSTGDCERHNHAVSGFEVFHLAPDFHHLTHELVPQDVTRFHGWNVAIVEMEVGTTNRCAGDPNDSVVRIENPGIIHRFYPYLFFTFPAECFHGFLQIIWAA